MLSFKWQKLQNQLYSNFNDLYSEEIEEQANVSMNIGENMKKREALKSQVKEVWTK